MQLFLMLFIGTLVTITFGFIAFVSSDSGYMDDKQSFYMLGYLGGAASTLAIALIKYYT